MCVWVFVNAFSTFETRRSVGIQLSSVHSETSNDPCSTHRTHILCSLSHCGERGATLRFRVPSKVSPGDTILINKSCGLSKSERLNGGRTASPDRTRVQKMTSYCTLTARHGMSWTDGTRGLHSVDERIFSEFSDVWCGGPVRFAPLRELVGQEFTNGMSDGEVLSVVAARETRPRARRVQPREEPWSAVAVLDARPLSPKRRSRSVWGGHWRMLRSDPPSELVHTGLKSPCSASYISPSAKPDMSQQNIVLRSIHISRPPLTTSYEPTRPRQL